MKRPAAGVVLALALGWSGVAHAAAPRLRLSPPSGLPWPARDAAARLRAEAEAAGLRTGEGEGGSGAGADAGDLRATVVAEGERPMIMIERPRRPPQLFRADDVSVDEAPGVVALRAVEWLKAELAPTLSPAQAPASLAQASDSPGAAPLTTFPARAGQPAAPVSPYRRPHLSASLAASLDGGDVTFAPVVALGAGVFGGGFVRLAGWGPSTRATVVAPQGSARVHSLGAAASAGWSWPLAGSYWLAASAGVGVARYAIEGRSTPGFVARRAVATSSLAVLEASVLRPLVGPVAAVASVGASFALPAVGVRIADVRVAERGRPELRAALGVQVAF
ncbi:MAG: hypothetical protein MUF34_22690 [Polyangiaceae bacterium]|nr:hypothetical protein [Polyangiaceae bacterium]